MKRQLLTPKEKEIVALLLKNYSNANIARQLNTTPKTVSVRLCQIYVEFKVNKQANPRQLFKNKIREMLSSKN